jgi:hypothetical protein
MQEMDGMDKRHLDRIRLLGTRFHALQGLRLAFGGVSLAMIAGVYLLAAAPPTNDGAIVCLLVASALTLAVQPYFNRYYADNFGRQVWKPSPHLKYAPLILTPYWMLGFYLNAKFPQIPAGTPTVVNFSLLALIVVALDWRWRAYYLLVPAAAAASFAATASAGGFLLPHLTLCTLFISIGTSVAAVGLLDHLLLVRLVKEAREPLTHPSAQSAD